MSEQDIPRVTVDIESILGKHENIKTTKANENRIDEFNTIEAQIDKFNQLDVNMKIHQRSIIFLFCIY
jgi:hypothetical protein